MIFKSMSRWAQRTARCLSVSALALFMTQVPVWAAGSYSIEFRVAGYQGADTLANVPVLVRLSTAITNFSYDKCQPNGEDVRFSLPDGTPLASEIDTWDPAGESLVWVLLPELAQGTVFNCEFNDRLATEFPASQTDGSVWAGAGYAGVWHFSEEEGVAVDSSPNALDAVPMKAVANCKPVPGVIGRGRQNAVGGADGYFSIPSYDQLALGGRFTVAGWFFADEASGYMRLFSRKDSWTEDAGWEFEMSGGSFDKFNARGVGSTSINGTFKTSMKKTWKHIALVYDDATLSVYEDGLLVSSGAIVSATDNGKPLSIGDNSNGSESHFRGALDECRLNASPFSAARVKVEHDAAFDKGFLAAGEAVPRSGGLSVQGDPFPYGEATPAYGITIGYVDGANVSASVSAVVTNEAEGVIATCAGFALCDLEGNQLETGTGNTHSFVFNSFRRVIWRFDRQFKVDLQAEGGSIEGASVWEPEGKVLTLSPVPADGNAFLRWAGDFPCAGSREKTISFTNGRPYTVIAVFRAKQAVRYHVAPDGDDVRNTGLSVDSPFRTPEMALSCAGDGDSVSFATGRYAVAKDLVVTNAVIFEPEPSAKGEVILTRRSDQVVNVLKLAHSNAVVRGIVFEGDRDKQWGEALVHITETGGLVEDCVIRNGRTWNNHTFGAGVRMFGGIVRDCIVTNNLVQSSGGDGRRGGGISLEGGLVERCFIHRNESNSGGGASGGGAHVAGQGILRNCLVTENIARNAGSGVYMTGGLVENCTIARNHHSLDADTINCAGLHLDSGTVRNTIISGNWNTKGELNFAQSSWTWSKRVEHCCSDAFSGPEKFAGTINIIANPQFVDPAKGDYRLSSSFCINAGTNQPWMAGAAVDLDGKPRVHGDIVDIGCYEFVPTKLVCSFDVTGAEGLGSVEATFSGHVAGPDLTAPVYTWDFGDGSALVTGADKAVVTHPFGPGFYTVKLTVADGGESVESVVEDCVRVSPETIYVDLANPAPVAPYLSRETAATSVHDAIAVAKDGCTVVVSDGVYTSTAPIKVFGDVDIRSENGPEATTLLLVREDGKTNGDKANFNVVYTGNPGIVLDGFTVSGAGRSALKFVRGGTIENCIVCDNKTINNTDDGSGINMEGPGLIRNCRIQGNFAKCSGGWGSRGGGLFVRNQVLVDSCVIVSNGVGYGNVSRAAGIYAERSTVRNCLIAWNHAAHNAAGAMIYGGSIENCSVVSNSSALKGGAADTARANHASGIVLQGNATARNLVVWGNTFADDWAREALSEGEKPEENRFLDCLVGNLGDIHGERNFAGDPLFKDPAAGDFHLKSTSPCRNRGESLEWMTPDATDLDGNRRVFEGHVDLGCYENVTFSGTMLLLR